MTARITAPVLLCSLLSLASASAWASPPEPGAEASEAVTVEAVAVTPVDPATPPGTIEPVVLAAPEPAPTTTEAPIVEDVPVDDYEPAYDPGYEPYVEPEPRRTTLELDSGYFGVGIAPGLTPYDGGFHPNTRFEMEFGGTLEHSYRDLALSFGVAPHITPYYERKTPSFGADVTMTTILGPVYLRTGLGAVGGLPRGHLLHETAAAIGGVVGLGLTFHRAPMVRVGVDYDFRVNTYMEPVHTFFLAVRVACCRKD